MLLQQLMLVSQLYEDQLLSLAESEGASEEAIINSFVDSQWAQLFKKMPAVIAYPQPAISHADQAAMDTFWMTEKRCFLFNRKFSKLLDEDPEFLILLRRAQAFIKNLVGSAPRCTLLKGRFTSGATTSTKRGASPHIRLNSSGVTENLRSFLAMQGYLRGCDDSRTLAEGTEPLQKGIERFPFHGAFITSSFASVGIFVPKTTKTSRLVFPEAVINQWVQSGLEGELVERLSRLGLVISQSQGLHRNLAKHSSYTRLLNTTDLRSASDLVSLELVKFLFPPSWWNWLQAARTEHIELPGGPLEGPWKLEKYSTMGNATTFVVETIVFLSILWACSGYQDLSDITDLHVYGDDMIYPRSRHEDVVAALGKCGFIVNTDKSFSEEFFRESCGGDFLLGTNVRPAYIKNHLGTSYEKTIAANRIRANHCRDGSWTRRDMRLIWLSILRSIPQSERYYGPEHYGDSVLHGDFTPRVRTSKWGRSSFRTWQAIAETKDLTDFGTLQSSFSCPRGRYPSRKFTRSHYNQSLIQLLLAGDLYGQGLDRNDKYRAYRPKAVDQTHRGVWTDYYEIPSWVTRDNPLDIFKHLKDTGCRPFLYAEDFESAYKAELIQRVIALLTAIKEREFTLESWANS